MFDDGISASEEEQLDLFNLIDMPWEPHPHKLTYKKIKKANRLDQSVFDFESKVVGDITRTGNRIEINTGLCLAPNPRAVNDDLLLTDTQDDEAVDILVNKYWGNLK